MVSCRWPGVIMEARVRVCCNEGESERGSAVVRKVRVRNVVCWGGVVLWSVVPGQALDAAAPYASVAMMWPRVREGEREGRV